MRSVFLIVGGAGASYLTIHYLLGGKEAVLELPFIYAGLIGTFAPLSLLFLWNLACAPYRIQRDARSALELENETLRALVKPNGRMLTPTQKHKISDLVNDEIKKSKDIIIWSFQSEESLVFAEEFRMAFRAAGWENASVYTSMIGGSLPASYRDVVIVKYPNSDMVLLSSFSELLTEFGIAHRIEPDPVDQPTEFLRIIIGRQS